MKHLFNPAPRSIKLTKSELLELWQYLCKCDNEGFTGHNNFKRLSREREYMYQWHLKEFANRILIKLMKHTHDPNSKNLTIKVSEAEQRTLSILFNRVDCTPYMLQLQSRLINHLTKTL